MNSDRYSIARDADAIAKFVAKITKWNLAYELYKTDNTNGFPRPVGKDAKWPAYEAAGRIERALGLETHASSVPELAAVAGAAIEWLNKNVV